MNKQSANKNMMNKQVVDGKSVVKKNTEEKQFNVKSEKPPHVRKLIVTSYGKRNVALYMEGDRVWGIYVLPGQGLSISIDEKPGYKQTGDKNPEPGELWIGKVVNVVPRIGAAFVDLRPGFTCYYSLEDLSCAVFSKKQSLKPIVCGDEIVVQMTKEASKNKLPGVSSKWVFHGDHIALTHGNTQIGVSSKLDKDIRENFRELLQPYKNDRCGFIVRTNAGNTAAKQLRCEVESLLTLYRSILDTAPYRPCYVCMKENQTGGLGRIEPTLLSGVEQIVVDDRSVFDLLKHNFADHFDLANKLCLYTDKNVTLSQLYGTETVIRRALAKKVWLHRGGFIVIEPTEALTVIDVNSGKQTEDKRKVDLAYEVNRDAVDEITRQIRLRNLSGIIIIDFINMSEEKMDQLCTYMKNRLSSDPIPTQLVDVTALGLMELTRKKTGKPLSEYFEKEQRDC